MDHVSGITWLSPIKLKRKKKKKLKKNWEDTDRKFFKCPSVYLFSVPQKRLMQSSLEFRIALKAFIVPRLILTLW